MGKKEIEGLGLGAADGFRLEIAAVIEFTSTASTTSRPSVVSRAVPNEGEASMVDIDSPNEMTLLLPIASNDDTTVNVTSQIMESNERRRRRSLRKEIENSLIFSPPIPV